MQTAEKEEGNNWTTKSSSFRSELPFHFSGMEMEAPRLAIASLLLLSSSLISVTDAQPKNFRRLPQSDVKPLVNDLVSRGFSISAAVVQPVQRLIPAHSTLLVPTNNAIANVTDNLSQEDILRSLQYHVVTFPASFRALSRREVGSELPTLLRGAVLRVTSNSPGSFAINGVSVTVPDLCKSTTSVACHGIDRVLIFNSSSLATAPAPFGQAPAPEVEGPAGAAQGPASVEVAAPGTSGTSNAKLNTTITSGIRSSSSSGAAALLAGVLACLLT